MYRTVETGTVRAEGVEGTQRMGGAAAETGGNSNAVVGQEVVDTKIVGPAVGKEKKHNVVAAVEVELGTIVAVLEAGKTAAVEVVVDGGRAMKRVMYWNIVTINQKL